MNERGRKCNFGLVKSSSSADGSVLVPYFNKELNIFISGCFLVQVIGSRKMKPNFWFSNVSHRRRQWHPHSSTLAWKIPWMEEPGGLQSMGSVRVGHDWVTSLSLFTFMHWRRKWQATPVFLPGDSQGRGSLVGCRLWGHTESDTTDVT